MFFDNDLPQYIIQFLSKWRQDSGMKWLSQSNLICFTSIQTKDRTHLLSRFDVPFSSGFWFYNTSVDKLLYQIVLHSYFNNTKFEIHSGPNTVQSTNYCSFGPPSRIKVTCIVGDFSGGNSVLCALPSISASFWISSKLLLPPDVFCPQTIADIYRRIWLVYCRP